MKNKSLPKIFVVAAREFWVTVRTKGYLITTFGMPLFLAMYIGIALIPSLLIEKKEAEKRIAGVVDYAGVIDFDAISEVSRLSESVQAMARDMGAQVPPTMDELKDMQEKALAEREAFDDVIPGPAGETGEENNTKKKKEKTPRSIKVSRYESEEEARADLDSEVIFSYFVVPVDYMDTGIINAYTKNSSLMSSNRWKSSFLRKGIYAGLFKNEINPALYARLIAPVDLIEHNISDTGETKERDVMEDVQKLGVPFAFAFLLMISMMMGGGFLITGLAEEKENRVMEVILSSATARQFFWGKLLGLGTASFIQFLIWMCIVMAVAGMGVVLAMVALEIPLSLVVLSLLYYLGGYFLFGSLMLGSAALGTNLRESQQLSMVWSMMNVIPMIGMILIIGEPNGIFARVLSYIPFTAPVTVVARLATGKMPLWEVPLTLATLFAGTWLAIRLGSKLFRFGLLMYGKKPSLKETWRWLREA